MADETDKREYRKISNAELKIVLAEHKKWLESDFKEGNRANLHKTDLSGAGLIEARLCRADLSEAYLSGADLRRAEFCEADLNKTDLSRAILYDSDLSKANLGGVNLRGAQLNNANLRDATLNFANLDHANLRWADMRGADCEGASMADANLWGASLQGAMLDEANLSRANLRDANLEKAFLRKVNFSNADLSVVILKNANLEAADLRNAILKDADLSEAILSHADLFDADLRGAKLNGVDLILCSIYKTRINESDLDGAIYEPEMLKFFIIEKREEPEKLTIPEGKGKLTVRIEKCEPLLLHLSMLTAFIDHQYSIFYIFLFSQYKSIEDLSSTLRGSLYHKFRESEDAVKMIDIKKGSLALYLIGAFSPFLLFFAYLYKHTPETIKEDFYKRLLDVLSIKTQNEKYEEELVKIEVMKGYAELKEKCRDIGVAPVDLIHQKDNKESLPPALLKDTPKTIAEHIERHKDFLSTREPRKDYLMSIKKMREEGLLTNNLQDVELANLLETINEQLHRQYESLKKPIGKMQFELEVVDAEE